MYLPQLGESLYFYNSYLYLYNLVIYAMLCYDLIYR